MTKEILRKEYKQKRAELTDDKKWVKSQNIQNLFIQSDIYKSSKCLMVYMPLGKETETDLIISRAFSDGKVVVIPVTDESTGRITPVVIDKNTEYIKGAFSVREPKEKILCPKEDIDTVVVPGIAFDKKGNRMGFGKGCYDMFLEDFNGVKVGMCYDFQLADDLPHSEYDIAMDYIFSDKIIIDCQ